MRRNVYFIGLITLFISALGQAQSTVTFEEFELAQDTFWNGSDGSGDFTLGEVEFNNRYTSDFGGLWDGGWSVSSKIDSVTSGFTNQYSAKTAGGFEGSANYAVAYQNIFAAVNPMIRLTSENGGQMVQGFYITNTTYAYNSMHDGDDFAKKFGGDDGTDPDYFKVTIRKWLDGNSTTDSIDFYLADFRFEDHSQDYIIKDWTWVDLSGLGEIDSLEFTLQSSDIGDFGINTPLYFCMDDLTVSPVSSIFGPGPLVEQISVFPNPAVDFIQIKLPGSAAKQGEIIIADALGRVVKCIPEQLDTAPVSVAELEPGNYWIYCKEGTLFCRAQFMKMR